MWVNLSMVSVCQQVLKGMYAYRFCGLLVEHDHSVPQVSSHTSAIFDSIFLKEQGSIVTKSK
uniref:Uncharacterized protein n=1 Tax=Arion vulgaris TaxID=1028688 RepID=A0A0B6YB14_9EUPU